MSTDSDAIPSFELAERAYIEARAGNVLEAVRLLEQARAEFDPETAPSGPDGQPELFWPDYWEGALSILDHLPTRLFSTPALRDDYALPLVLSLDSLGDSA